MTDTPDATPAEAITLAALVLHQDACDDCGTEFCNGNPMPVEFALARRVLAAVAPVIAARATAAERAKWLLAVRKTCACDDCKTDIANLLGGASRSAQTVSAAPGSVPKVTGPETSHEDRSVDPGATQGHT